MVTPRLGLPILMLIGGLGFPSLYLSTESCGCNATDIDADGYCDVEDCAPEDPQSFPDAEEVCDGIDNNCDGSIDESVGTLWYQDSDGDGFGDATHSVLACNAPVTYVDNADDCADGDAGVHPGAIESCDQVDQDCDGEVDEGLQDDYFEDLDEDGYGDGEVVLTSCTGAEGGLTSLEGDCDDTNPAINPESKELCDEQDNDCDGDTDEGVQNEIFEDLDGDTFGTGENGVWSCDPLIVCEDFERPETCEPVKGITTLTNDCDDNDPGLNPSQPEICDGRDNNCDGLIDIGIGPTWYPDADGDGAGSGSGAVQSCSQPEGLVATADDCNDSSATVHPGAIESCNLIDDDCNGLTDEKAGPLWYPDLDGDGYYAGGEGVQSCSQTSEGYVTTGGDCNDADSGVHPAAEEVCDDIDNNCDGGVDEELFGTWYEDADGDGYGSGLAPVKVCKDASASPQQRRARVSASGVPLVQNALDCLDHDSGDGAAAYIPNTIENLNELQDKNCDGWVEFEVNPAAGTGLKQLNIPWLGDLLELKLSRFVLPTGVTLEPNQRITLRVARANMLATGEQVKAFQQSTNQYLIGPQVEYQFYKATLNDSGQVVAREPFSMTERDPYTGKGTGFSAEVVYRFSAPEGASNALCPFIYVTRMEQDPVTGVVMAISKDTPDACDIDDTTLKAVVKFTHKSFSTYAISTDSGTVMTFWPKYDVSEDMVSERCVYWSTDNEGAPTCIQYEVEVGNYNETDGWEPDERGVDGVGKVQKTLVRDWQFLKMAVPVGTAQPMNAFRTDIFYAPEVYGEPWTGDTTLGDNRRTVVVNGTERTVQTCDGPKGECRTLWAAKVTSITPPLNGATYYTLGMSFINNMGKDIDVEMLFPFVQYADSTNGNTYADDPSTAGADEALLTSLCSMEVRQYAKWSNLGMGIDCLADPFDGEDPNEGYTADTLECMDFKDLDLYKNGSQTYYATDDLWNPTLPSSAFKKPTMGDPYECLRIKVCGTPVYKAVDEDGDKYYSREKTEVLYVCEGDSPPPGFDFSLPSNLPYEGRDADGADCDDKYSGGDKYPGNPDPMNDGKDSNCDGVELCPGHDWDRDGYSVGTVDSRNSTCGDGPGEYGFDENPHDTTPPEDGSNYKGLGDCLDNPANPDAPDVHPGADFHTKDYLVATGEKRSFDWNCNDLQEKSDTRTSLVTPFEWYTPWGTTWIAQCAAGWENWTSTHPPVCGETRYWADNYYCWWVGGSDITIGCK